MNDQDREKINQELANRVGLGVTVEKLEVAIAGRCRLEESDDVADRCAAALGRSTRRIGRPVQYLAEVLVGQLRR